MNELSKDIVSPYNQDSGIVLYTSEDGSVQMDGIFLLKKS